MKLLLVVLLTTIMLTVVALGAVSIYQRAECVVRWKASSLTVSNGEQSEPYQTSNCHPH
jgi:hypothetical protein